MYQRVIIRNEKTKKINLAGATRKKIKIEPLDFINELLPIVTS